ncbi:MAG: ClbS/DfsB family four-helix bundle protein [Chloroflexi bacterium]|nr:ClbS/DfsB family four-helix bundle protein [Chloroflexota bacterium]
MTKQEFLSLLLFARAEWEAALNEDGEERMNPIVYGEWTVKDLIAHVSWFVSQMVGVLKEKALVGSELWRLKNDERNAILFKENHGRDLKDVLEEDKRVYKQFLELFNTLNDEDLNEAAHFREMPPDWIPWEVLRGNTYKHYEEHAQELRAWLRLLREEPSQ